MVSPQSGVLVHRRDAGVLPGTARAVAGGQGGGALLQVPGLAAGLGGAGDGQGVDGVGVAVTVAVVRVEAAIAAGPHEDGAQTSSALRDSLQESLLGQRAGAVHSLAVILGAPAGGVDVDVGGIEGETASLHRIVDQPVQHPDSTNAGVVGDTRPTVVVVGHGRHLPGTPSTVLVVSVVLRHRVVVIGVDVLGGEGVVVLGQVWVVVLDPVIQDRHHHSPPSIAQSPGLQHLHVAPVHTASVYVPLRSRKVKFKKKSRFLD